MFELIFSSSLFEIHLVKKLIVFINTQIFKYRIIVGLLTLLLIGLGFYTYLNYKKYKEQEAFVSNEAKLSQGELNEIFYRYDKMVSEKQAIKNQLNQVKFALDSIKELYKNLSLLNKYDAQSLPLVYESNTVVSHIDSLEKKQERLKNTLDQVSKQNNSDISTIIKDKNNLKQVVRDAYYLQIKHLKVTAKGYALKNGELPQLKFTNSLEVCATFKGNKALLLEDKKIYVQVVSPENKLISYSGVLNYADKTLKFSAKTIVNQVDNDKTKCLEIDLNPKSKLTPGKYTISIYQDTKHLKSTTITLN